MNNDDDYDPSAPATTSASTTARAAAPARGNLFARRASGAVIEDDANTNADVSMSDWGTTGAAATSGAGVSATAAVAAVVAAPAPAPSTAAGVSQSTTRPFVPRGAAGASLAAPVNVVKPTAVRSALPSHTPLLSTGVIDPPGTFAPTGADGRVPHAPEFFAPIDRAFGLFSTFGPAAAAGTAGAGGAGTGSSGGGPMLLLPPSYGAQLRTYFDALSEQYRQEQAELEKKFLQDRERRHADRLRREAAAANGDPVPLGSSSGGHHRSKAERAEEERRQEIAEAAAAAAAAAPLLPGWGKLGALCALTGDALSTYDVESVAIKLREAEARGIAPEARRLFAAAQNALTAHQNGTPLAATTTQPGSNHVDASTSSASFGEALSAVDEAMGFGGAAAIAAMPNQASMSVGARGPRGGAGAVDAPAWGLPPAAGSAPPPASVREAREQLNAWVGHVGARAVAPRARAQLFRRTNTSSYQTLRTIALLQPDAEPSAASGGATRFESDGDARSETDAVSDDNDAAGDAALKERRPRGRYGASGTRPPRPPRLTAAIGQHGPTFKIVRLADGHIFGESARSATGITDPLVGKGHIGVITSLAAAAAGTRVVSAAAVDGTLRLWDVRRVGDGSIYCAAHAAIGKQPRDVAVRSAGALPRGAWLSPDANTSTAEEPLLLWSGGADGVVRVWDPAVPYRPGGCALAFGPGCVPSPAPPSSVSAGLLQSDAIQHVVFHPARPYEAVVRGAKCVTVWDMRAARNAVTSQHAAAASKVAGVDALGRIGSAAASSTPASVSTAAAPVAASTSIATSSAPVPSRGKISMSSILAARKGPQTVNVSLPAAGPSGGSPAEAGASTTLGSGALALKSRPGFLALLDGARFYPEDTSDTIAAPTFLRGGGSAATWTLVCTENAAAADDELSICALCAFDATASTYARVPLAYSPCASSQGASLLHLCPLAPELAVLAGAQPHWHASAQAGSSSSPAAAARDPMLGWVVASETSGRMQVLPLRAEAGAGHEHGEDPAVAAFKAQRQVSAGPSWAAVIGTALGAMKRQRD